MADDKSDFAALRAKRDASIMDVVRRCTAELGGDPDKVTFHSHDFGGCYCACPDGPCEHQFGGWREFEGGGEQVCKLCGMGAMSHSLTTGM